MVACVARDDRRLRNAPLSMPEASLLQLLRIQLTPISLEYNAMSSRLKSSLHRHLCVSTRNIHDVNRKIFAHHVSSPVQNFVVRKTFFFPFAFHFL